MDGIQQVTNLIEELVPILVPVSYALSAPLVCHIQTCEISLQRNHRGSECFPHQIQS